MKIKKLFTSRILISASLPLFSLLISCGPTNQEKQTELRLIPLKSGEDFQFITREGKIEISPIFPEASMFRCGLALVKEGGKEGKWRFITEAGKFAFPASYASATVFSENLAWVVEPNEGPKAINTKGETVINLPDAEEVFIFREGLAGFRKNQATGNAYGFVDTEGKVKIPASFINAGNFSEGLCRVANSDGKWGYIDADGNLKINYQFDSAADFRYGHATVWQNNSAGLIDEDGKFLITPKFSRLISDRDYCLAEKDGKWGWTDFSGNFVIQPTYQMAYPFYEGELAAIKTGSKWGYINKEGKTVIKAMFDQAFPFLGDLAIIESGGKTGLLDKQGNFYLKQRYDKCALDLQMFFKAKATAFNSAQTDFFSLAPILNRIQFDQPEGMPLISRFSDISSKFGVKEKNLDSVFAGQIPLNEHELLTEEKVNGEARLKTVIFAPAHRIVRNGKKQGLISNDQVFVTAYKYSISLSEKAKGKESSIIQGLEKKMKDLKKNDLLSTADRRFYSSSNNMVEIRSRPGLVTLLISPKNIPTNKSAE
jgi:hypothetical protein